MEESILKSAFRRFVLVVSTFLAIIVGISLLFILPTTLADTIDGEPTITYKYNAKIIPNAQGTREKLPSSYPVILKIDIHGEIGTAELNRQSMESLLVESRERAFKDDRVEAIILHIDTPGGTVFDSNAIYRALKLYKTRYQTPIYAYVDGLCASGGIYVACSADKIYSSDVSIIGSVGAILGPFMNYSKLLDKIGVESETVTAGKDKDLMNPLRPWKKDESVSLQNITDQFYEHFIDLVTTNRPKISKDKLRNEYGAHVFTAKDAEDYGFIDGSNMSFDDVVSLLVKEIGIDDNMYQVVEFENNNWVSSIFKLKGGLGILSGEIKHTLDLPPQLNPEFMNQPLYLYTPQ